MESSGSDVELAIRASQAGAAVVHARYGGPLERIDKAPLDFATDADVEAERAIVDVLRAARPADSLLGEESGATPGASKLRTWLIDPLCGTLNFAARTPLMSVNVALRVDDQVDVAAVSDPFSGETMWTDGARAHRRHNGTDEQLVPSSTSRLVDVNLDGPFPNAEQFRAVTMLADPAFNDRFRPRVCSTTLALAWVAAGRRAAYITDGHLRDSVHFTGGIAVCQAAGCIVTDLRGQPVHSGTGGLLAAADQPTHSALLAIIDRQLPG